MRRRHSHRGAALTDWNAQLEKANRHIAELETKISAQHHALRGLSGEGAAARMVARMLDVLKQNLERAGIYKRFIESQLDRAGLSARRNGS
jgi:uncharacterized coiled-coil protein SlyX